MPTILSSCTGIFLCNSIRSPILALTYGQWLQIKTTNTVLESKWSSEYMLPSTPLRLKLGAVCPVLRAWLESVFTTSFMEESSLINLYNIVKKCVMESQYILRSAHRSQLGIVLGRWSEEFHLLELQKWSVPNGQPLDHCWTVKQKRTFNARACD
jgi:hypothetical protein